MSTVEYTSTSHVLHVSYDVQQHKEHQKLNQRMLMGIGRVTYPTPTGHQGEKRWAVSSHFCLSLSPSFSTSLFCMITMAIREGCIFWSVTAAVNVKRWHHIFLLFESVCVSLAYKKPSPSLGYLAAKFRRLRNYNFSSFCFHVGLCYKSRTQLNLNTYRICVHANTLERAHFFIQNFIFWGKLIETEEDCSG